LAISVVVAAATAVTTAVAANAAAGCSVTYAVSSQWQGGFGASVNIKNLGDPLTSWRLTWSFSAGQTITQLWNGTPSQSGSQVTVTNVSYNGNIPTGGSQSFGFNGSWNGSNPAPTSFALNGVTCNDGVSNPTSGAPVTTQGPITTAPVTTRGADHERSAGDDRRSHDRRAHERQAHDRRAHDGRAHVLASVDLPLDVVGCAGAAEERLGVAEGLHQRRLQRQAPGLRLVRG